MTDNGKNKIIPDAPMSSSLFASIRCLMDARKLVPTAQLWGCLAAVSVVLIAGCFYTPKAWRPDQTAEEDCRLSSGLCGNVDGANGQNDASKDGLVADVFILDIGDADGVGDVVEVTDSDTVVAQDVGIPDVTDDSNADADGDGADTEEVVEIQDIYFPSCPNGSCDPEENKDNCPADCCSPCGDGVCDSQPPCEETCPEDCCYCGDGKCGQCPGMPAETVSTCAEDCSTCGDGICSGKESAIAGDPAKCLVDCCGSCGDKVCKGGECFEDDVDHAKFCLKDCDFACGNGSCEGGESPAICPQDCELFACGNHVCEPGEDPVECPQDCSGSCGDCKCDTGESNENCPIDCGFCGDGTCTTCLNLNETTKFCPQDCCNDGNLCTDDISILADGVYICSHVVNDLADCEVDLPCTTGDYCEGGLCIAGDQEALCDDESPCTIDWCDQATGGCHFEPDTGSDCDDGDPCTKDDKCELGECQPGAQDDCDDGNQCTADACLNVEPIVGCVNQPKIDETSCNQDPCGDSAVCKDGICVCD